MIQDQNYQTESTFRSIPFFSFKHIITTQKRRNTSQKRKLSQKRNNLISRIFVSTYTEKIYHRFKRRKNKVIIKTKCFLTNCTCDITCSNNILIIYLRDSKNLDKTSERLTVEFMQKKIERSVDSN